MIIIGIGNKARQGKDTLALALKEWLDLDPKFEVKIFHFADALKEECFRLHFKWDSVKLWWHLHNPNLSPKETAPDAFPITQVIEPRNSNFMRWLHVNGRVIESCVVYNGMEQKDTYLLQFWGSFRREQDKSYWIVKLSDTLFRWEDESTSTGITNVALIPDTRYENEANWIRFLALRDERTLGKVWRVRRSDHFGAQKLSGDRDPRHPSEIDLDTYQFDAELVNLDGKVGIEGMLAQAQNLFTDLLLKRELNEKTKS